MTNKSPHTRSHGLTSAQVLPWRGTVHTLKRTRATPIWLEALDRAGLAKPPRNVAVVLTGQPRKKLLDIGEAQFGTEGKARFVAVFLHDWPAGDFDDLYGLLSKRLRKLFPASARRDALTAYLAKVALHEVGHARQQLRSTELTVEEAEADAEDHAWRELERRLPAETVFRALAVFAMAGRTR